MTWSQHLVSRNHGITRRSLFARSLVLTSGVFSLAACTDVRQQPPSTAEARNPIAPAAPPTVLPKYGGTLRMSQAADIQPAFAPYSLVTYNQFLYSLVYDTLVSYDANLNPQPGLATSWEWSPDFLQLTLKLRAGVKFHSGRPFTSADARFNLERLRDPAANSQLLNYAREMQVETPDPGTLVIKYSAPARSSFDALAAALMADSQTLDQLREGHGFVGTGAFRFKEWMQGDHFTVQRNQDYWQPGRPYLDQVEVRIAADPQSALVFLETGSLDWMSGVPAQDALRLKVTQIISCFSTVAVAFFTTWASMSAAPP